jgi:predicted HAD superfamily Cof-like phosphohydrolase
MSLTNLTEHAQRVLSFMLRAKQNCPVVPTLPDEKTRILRAKLIFEEAMELIKDGLGIDVSIETDKEGNAEYAFKIVGPGDLVQIADGFADLSVVNTGTALACGMEDVRLLEIVDRNNLAKFRPGHSFREDGKLIKPPDHQKPDFKSELMLQEHAAKHA